MRNDVYMTGVEQTDKIDAQVQSTLETIKNYLNDKAGKVFLTIQPEPHKKGIYSVMIVVSGLPRAAKSKASGSTLIQAVKSAQKKVIQQILERRKRQHKLKKHRHVQLPPLLPTNFL